MTSSPRPESGVVGPREDPGVVLGLAAADDLRRRDEDTRTCIPGGERRARVTIELRDGVIPIVGEIDGLIAAGARGGRIGITVSATMEVVAHARGLTARGVVNGDVVGAAREVQRVTREEGATGRD